MYIIASRNRYQTNSKFTKYQCSWEKGRPWLSPVKDDMFKAYCTACSQTMQTRMNGTDKLKQHEKTTKHVKAVQEMSDQTCIVPKKDGCLHLSQSTLKGSYSLEQQVVRTEILQALHVVDVNQSYASVDGNSERFKRMFPYSKIATKYAQHANKLRYVIVYGLASYVKELMLKDARDTFFTYKFDETTTSQVKKQYDGYITYFSKQFEQIVTVYCDSLFVGHCSYKDLVQHFYVFLESLQFSTVWLVNIGMDGPSVNQSFLRLLQLELVEKAHSFFNIGSCPLHIVNNAFKKVFTVLKPVIDLDLIATDLHFFFKRSPARRQDYRMVEDITEITVWYLKKHVDSRWLNTDRSLVKILDQMENLREYFLVQLSRQKGFNGKNGLSKNDRYQRICSMLKNKDAEVCISFVIYLARDFSRFMVPLQTSAPMIHRLP